MSRTTKKNLVEAIWFDIFSSVTTNSNSPQYEIHHMVLILSESKEELKIIMTRGYQKIVEQYNIKDEICFFVSS